MEPTSRGLEGTTGIGIICRWFAVLGCAIFGLEAVMSVISIIGRATIQVAVPGDYELVGMLSAAGVALCLPYCEYRHGHVFVDFFTLWASPGLKRVLDTFARLLLCVVAFVLAWRSWVGMLEMREYGESSMVLALPIWYAYIPLAPSFVLLGVTALLNAFHHQNTEVR